MVDSGQQYELLDWLAKTTFPMEAKFDNADCARKVYKTVVRRIIDSGVRVSRGWSDLLANATASDVPRQQPVAITGLCI